MKANVLKADSPVISKIGGSAWIPEGIDISAKVKDLRFVAQINFAEMPKLAGYPTSGLLQFYCDVQQKKNPYVLYIQDVNGKFVKTDIPKISDEKHYIEMDHEMYKLSGMIGPSIPIFNKEVSDLLFYVNEALGTTYRSYDDIPDKVRSQLFSTCRKYDAHTHQIGGYPYFCQHDARTEKYNTVLLQIASCGIENVGIFWGDYGCANFFINDKMLAKKDFSDVKFYWDCD